MNSLIYKTWKPIIYKNAAVPSSKKGDFIRISPYVVPWALPYGIGNFNGKFDNWTSLHKSKATRKTRYLKKLVCNQHNIGIFLDYLILRNGYQFTLGNISDYCHIMMSAAGLGIIKL